MVNINKIQSVQHAGQYFTDKAKEDYYTQGQTQEHSQWMGKGAEALGLAGAVTQEDFQNILAGKDKDGNDLNGGSRHNDRKVGWDVTFSASKEVSVLWAAADDAGKKQIEEAHQKAVDTVFNYMQEHFAQARELDQNGVQQRVDTHNLVAARFDHFSTRPLPYAPPDPDLHSHLAIANTTQRQDGLWRALKDNKLFQKDQLIKMYENEMVHNMRNNGYAAHLEHRGDGKNAYCVVDGVDKDLVDAFSKRTEQINARVEELRKQFPNASDGQLQEMAAKDTRGRKQEYNQETLQKSWDEQIREQGKTPEQIIEQAKEAGRQAQQERQAHEAEHGRITPEELAKITAERLTQNESTFSRDDLVKAAAAMGQSRLADIDKAVRELQERGEIIHLRGEDVYSTKVMCQIELENVKMMQDSQGQRQAIMSQADAQKIIEEKYTGKLEGQRALTEGQREALEHMLTSKDGVSGISGVAGSGKTTLLGAFKSEAEQRGERVIGLAYTGKAAQGIQQKADIDSKTLHSFVNGVESGRIKLLDEQQFDDNAKNYQRELDKFTSKERKEVSQPIKPEDLNSELRKKSTEGHLNADIKDIAKGKVHQEFEDGQGAEKHVIKTETQWTKDELRNMRNNVVPEMLGGRRNEQNSTEHVYIKSPEGKVSHGVSHVQHYQLNEGWHYEKTTLWDKGNITKLTVETGHDREVIEQKTEKFAAPENTIRKGNLTIVMDEASMSDSMMMNKIEKIAKDADAKIDAIYDKQQLQSIGAGKVAADLEKHGMATIEMKESVRPKTEYQKELFNKVYEDPVKSVEFMKEQGRVHEFKAPEGMDKDEARALERQQMKDKAVELYMQSPDNSMIATNTNEMRRELNEQVRQEFHNQGRLNLDQQKEVTVRESKALTNIEQSQARNWEKGDIVAFNEQVGNVKAGTEGRVVATDTRHNTMTVEQTSGKNKGETVNVDLTRHGDKVNAYQERQESFTKNDEIMFTKNDSQLDVLNGNRARVLDIDDKGNVRAGILNEDRTKIEREVTFNTGSYGYVTTSYAQTTHKSQGDTISAEQQTDKPQDLQNKQTDTGGRNIICKEAESKMNNANSHLVDCTRAENDTHLVTNDVDKYTKRVQMPHQKESTLDYQKPEKPEPSKAPERQMDKSQDKETSKPEKVQEAETSKTQNPNLATGQNQQSGKTKTRETKDSKNPEMDNPASSKVQDQDSSKVQNKEPGISAEAGNGKVQNGKTAEGQTGKTQNLETSKSQDRGGLER